MFTRPSPLNLTVLLASALSLSAFAQERNAQVPFEEQIVLSDGSAVKQNQGGYMGHGYIVGSPINSGMTGMIFKTYEVHINQGRFTDDRTYIGSNVGLSIDNKNTEIFNAFQKIESRNHELFVFEYIHKSGWNPEVEDGHLFLTKIYTIPEFLEKIGGNSISKGIQARNPWQGSNGIKKKMGRIVDVERLGNIGDFCAVEVNLGGLSGQQGGGEALVTLSVVDEDICVWVEKALAQGRDVEIDVSIDNVETWQPSDSFITAIKFRDEDPTSPAQLEAGKLTEEQYQELKQRLLKDPEFLQKLIENANKSKP